MTCRELLQMLKADLDKNIHIEESETKTTDIHGQKDNSEMLIMIPVEGKARMIKVHAVEIEPFKL